MRLLKQKIYSTEDDLLPLVAAGGVGVAGTVCLAAKKKKPKLRGNGYGHIKASIKNDEFIKCKFYR